MKQIVKSYVFNPAARTITFTHYVEIELSRLTMITNVTDGIIIFQFNNPNKGGTVSGNVLTLEYDTTSMSASDDLRIDYDALATDPVYDRTVVGNAQRKFRDSFASQDVQPDPTVWDVTKDDGSEHIITQGGNSSGSSYLRISLSPFVESSGVVLNSKQTFGMPMRTGFGVSMSQRVSGQEVFVGMVGVDQDDGIEYITAVPDKPLTGSTVSIASNVGTFTLTNHGFVGGDRVTVVGCAEKRLNVGPVVVTVLTADTFTLPVTLANGTYSAVGGFVRTVDPLRYAKNGAGLLFESTTATGASFVSRRNGAKYRSTNMTVSSTTATQTNTNPYTDAFNTAANHEIYYSLDEVAVRSYAADAGGTLSGFNKYTQSVPEGDIDYKIQIRARSLNGITLPVAKITNISKSGSTTATVTTDVPHGLIAGDYVQIYGVRDATNFPNLTAQTVVASTVNSTTFTVVQGSSATATSNGGVVWQNQGSVLAPGAIAANIQSVARTNNILTVTAATTISGPLAGEYVQLHGLTLAPTLEGAYKVLRVSGSTLELESVGADVASTNTGGAVIRRTDVRLHFARVMDYTRLVTEVVGGKGQTNDANNAVPVTVAATVSTPVTQSTGSTVSMWAASGYAGFVVADIASAAITSTATSTAVSPGQVANIGSLAHSFAVIVTAVSGTSPTLDVSIEESPDGGTNWIRVYDFPRITATGTYVTPIIKAKWGNRYRYVRTVGGTTPSFTMSLNRLMFSEQTAGINQFFDRSIVLTTLNSTTPSYFVDGANKITLYVNIGAATTAPALQLEGSEDNTSWYALGTPLTAVANSTVLLDVSTTAPKWVRARVSTAGSAVTAGYVSIKARE